MATTSLENTYFSIPPISLVRILWRKYSTIIWEKIRLFDWLESECFWAREQLVGGILGGFLYGRIPEKIWSTGHHWFASFLFSGEVVGWKYGSISSGFWGSDGIFTRNEYSRPYFLWREKVAFPAKDSYKEWSRPEKVNSFLLFSKKQDMVFGKCVVLHPRRLRYIFWNN